jgi:hypothetical protein
MNGKLRIGIVALLVVGALGVVVTGTAFAQESTPTPAPLYGHGFGRGMGGEVGLEAAAEALGMTADELSLQMWGGKTLADLAEEKGVDLQDVQDAVNAALEQAQRDAIEQAVEDGTITREHADWLLEGLDNGYWGVPGASHMGGRGGFRGMGGSRMRGGFQNAIPSADTNL